jgi:2-alkyl-3-oxoalkanoate reductase
VPPRSYPEDSPPAVYDAVVSASLRRVLVTGASGFLGGHVVHVLVGRGVAVNAQGRDASRLSFTGDVRSCRFPLSDTAALAAAAIGCDAIVHAAALSAPWGARQEFIDANVTGTANVIAAARVSGVRRLVHISLPAVIFDGGDQHLIDDTTPYPARLGSDYARTKRAAEELVRAASGELETVIIRPKAIYGAGDRALVPRLVRAARRGTLPQIGDGTNAVDITHVDDVAHAIQCALDTTDGIGETFLVTGGEHVPLWAMIRELLSGIGLPLPRRTVPLGVALAAASVMEAVAAITGREPTLTRYSAQILARTQTYDISRARQRLGYAPRVTCADGLARTIDALRDGMRAT